MCVNVFVRVSMCVCVFVYVYELLCVCARVGKCVLNTEHPSRASSGVCRYELRLEVQGAGDVSCVNIWGRRCQAQCMCKGTGVDIRVRVGECM
jgi:hypothetical protein